MLWLYQRVFFTEINPKIEGHLDIDAREVLTLMPLIALVLWIGVYPNTFLGFMDASVLNLMERLREGTAVAEVMR